jgi:hypothetical protein
MQLLLGHEKIITKSGISLNAGTLNRGFTVSNKNAYFHELIGHKRSRHCNIHIMWYAGHCWDSTTYGITPHETVLVLTAVRTFNLTQEHFLLHS